MGIVVEEADETVYWLELISDNGIMPKIKDVSFTERGDRVGGNLYSFTFNFEGGPKVNYPISQFPNYSI